MLRSYGARVVAITKDYTIFETTGQRAETDKLIEVLAPYGLIEFVRSARVAIIKDSKGFHEKLKEFEEAEPVNNLLDEFLSEEEATSAIV